MKIAQITPFFYPVIGGLETHVLNLSTYLIKRGHKVTVFTSDKSRRGVIPRKEECINGITVKRFPIWVDVSEFAKVWPGFVGELLNGKFDVIHAHNYRHFHCDLSALASKLSQTACVMTTHAPYFYEKIRPRTYQLLAKIYDYTAGKVTLNFYDRIIALTDAEFPWLLKHGTKIEKIRVIPNGITSDVLKEGSGERFRKKYGLDGPIVLSVGRIHRSKGLQFLLSAAPLVLREIPEVTFLIVGPDAGYVSELRNLAERLRIEKNVIFTGPLFKEELRDAYAACTLFALPSICEGFGIVLLEAMAQNKPVIATRSGGPSSIVINGENGYLVTYGDVNELANLIVKIVRDEALSNYLGTSGKEYARRHTWNKIAVKVEKVYIEILKNKGLRGS